MKLENSGIIYRNSLCSQPSTGQKTRATAIKIENRVRELAGLGKLGELVTVEQACARYFDEVGLSSLNPRAKKQQQLCMNVLIAHFGADTPLLSITPNDISRAAAARARQLTPSGKLVAAGTINRQLIEPLRRILRRARKQWGVQIDLDQFQWGGRDGVLRREPAGRTRELTPDEERRFWAHLDEDYRDLCELFIITGKRQSIWVGLLKTAVDVYSGIVTMPLLKKEAATQVRFKLTAREFEIISRAMSEDPDSPYVFTARSLRAGERARRRPITTAMLYRHVRKACDAAGIKDFRPHDFRHTFASRALREDGNLKKLQEALDHSDIESTLRYAHILQEDVTKLRATVRVNRSDEEGPDEK